MHICMYALSSVGSRSVVCPFLTKKSSYPKIAELRKLRAPGAGSFGFLHDLM